MFTLFHALVLVGFLLGGILGARAGAVFFGSFGGVCGGIIGALAGVVVGRVPGWLVLRSLARELGSKGTAELRASLHTPGCLHPNCILLELRRRGEDIRCELPVVLNLLVSEDCARRGQGWAALSSAFPELVQQVSDYRIGDSVDECRRKTETLRGAV